MAMRRLRPDQVARLADDVRAKILEHEALLAGSEGEIAVRIFRKGEGFQIKLTVTTL